MNNTHGLLLCVFVLYLLGGALVFFLYRWLQRVGKNWSAPPGWHISVPITLYGTRHGGVTTPCTCTYPITSPLAF